MGDLEKERFYFWDRTPRKKCKQRHSRYGYSVGSGRSWWITVDGKMTEQIDGLGKTMARLKELKESEKEV